MKAKLLLILALINTIAIAQTPSWQWAKRVGSFNDNYAFAIGDQNERFNDIKVDTLGNVYAVGEFFQNSAFDNQTMGFPTTGGYGERDAYLFKFSECGKTLWWRRMGGTNRDAAKSLVFDSNGNIIILGASGSGTYTVGDGVNDTIITSNNAVFLARYDTAGNFINVLNTYPTFPNIFGTRIITKLFIDSQNNYFITDGMQAVRINSLGVATNFYNYTATSGNVPGIRGIALDKNDNVYISGSFDGTVTIGGSTITTMNVPPGVNNSLIYKFSPSGTLLWINTSNPSGGGGDVLGTCTIDTSGTKLITGGVAYLGITVFGYTVSPQYVQQYGNVFYVFDTNTGNLLSATTATMQYVYFASPIYTGKDNTIYCAGALGGYLAFNTATYTSNPPTSMQMCIGVYNIISNTVSLNMVPQGFGSPGNFKDVINAMDADNQGNILICGMFSGKLDSLGTAVNIIGGAEDGFVAKYGYACACAASTATINPSACNSYTSPSGNYVWNASGSYQDTLVNFKGCDSLIIINLTINPDPVLSANSGAICEGQSFTITTGGAITYTYSGGSAVVSPVANTTYTVTGTNAQGCTGTALSTVTVNPLPTVNISGTVSVICEGESIVLNATGANSYTWSTNDNGNAVTFSPTSTTAYSVRGTDANGCENSALATQAVDPCTGIKYLANFDGDLKLYPNPGNGQLTIDLPEDAQTVITDALGRVVYNKRLKAGIRSIVIKEATNGIYFVKITTDEKQFVKQIVIER